MVTIGVGLQDLQVVLLLFARLSAIIAVAPIFSHPAVPVPVRSLFAGFFAVVLFMAGVGAQINVPAPFGMFLLLMLQEAAFGLLIGFLSTLLFTGIGMAAQLIGLQSSFGFTNVVDPLSQEQGSIIDQLYLLLAALIFLAVDGHHALLRAVGRSYDLVPVGQFVARTGPDGELLLDQVVRAIAATFEITLRIGLPVLAPLFIADLAMAILARTMPQMPVFLVGAPAKILVSIIILIITLPALLEAMTVVFNQVFVTLFQSMRAAAAS